MDFREMIGVESSMRGVSLAEAGNALEPVLDGVSSNVDCAVITRPDADDTVVMSPGYYNSLMETVRLLKSPANAAHLAESINQYRAGQVTELGTVDG